MEKQGADLLKLNIEYGEIKHQSRKLVCIYYFAIILYLISWAKLGSAQSGSRQINYQKNYSRQRDVRKIQNKIRVGCQELEKYIDSVLRETKKEHK